MSGCTGPTATSDATPVSAIQPLPLLRQMVVAESGWNQHESLSELCSASWSKVRKCQFKRSHLGPSGGRPVHRRSCVIGHKVFARTFLPWMFEVLFPAAEEAAEAKKGLRIHRSFITERSLVICEPCYEKKHISHIF
eukprot:s424_g7.t1